MRIPDDSVDELLPGEPPVSISLTGITDLGNLRLRRRRYQAVGGGVVAVAMIAIGSAVGLQTGGDAVAGSSIPGCSSVAPATAANISQDEPSDGSAAGVPLSPVADPRFVTPDPATAPNAWTAALWRKISGWEMTYRPDSGLGSLQFSVPVAAPGNPEVLTSASDGRVRSASGDGSLTVVLSDDAVVPPCVAGELDRRVTFADGTVVDVKFETYGLYDSDGKLTGRFEKNSAVSYHPDGTKVIVLATNEAPRQDDDPSQTGTARTFGIPLTVDQVLELAGDPGLRMRG